MPVYHKGRVPPRRLRAADDESIARSGNQRFIRPSMDEPWPAIRTPLRKVEKNLGLSLRNRLQRIRKPRVIDWGCGMGTALEQLARLFPNGEFFGFSREKYMAWERNGKRNTAFIHAPASDFVRYFRRKPVDVIYSHAGLSYLASNALIDEGRPFHDYVRGQLVPCLKPGGILVMDLLEGPAECRVLLGPLRRQPNLRVRRTQDSVIIQRKK